MGDEENSSKGASEKSWLEEAREIRRQILESRGGKPIEGDIISQLREGLCEECGRDILDVTEHVKERKREVSQMSTQPEPRPRKARVSRPRRLISQSYIDKIKELQERILAERGGVLVPDSSPDFRAMREGVER